MWVPPLRRDVALLLDRSRNPFFEHAEAEYFLAEREGIVVGRIAAIANRLHNETHQDRVGFFGFFESTNDSAVADALFEAAAAWLRPRGFDTMRGPASFSVNDECGLLIDGFDTPPTLLMPHNPPYYVDLVERAGFTTAKNLLVYQGGDLVKYKPVPERLVRATEIMRQRMGITLRPLDMRDFRNEVERIKVIYNAAWEKNWGFVPMTDREIEHLAEQFRQVAVPDIIPFAEKDGKVVMVIGSPGGSRIITAVFQVILNVLEHDMGMQQAVDARRMHSQWLPDAIYIEKNTLSQQDSLDLVKLGHTIRPIQDFHSTFIGRVSAILVLPDGKMEAGADNTRGGDTADGY
jgi:hypothetical protein